MRLVVDSSSDLPIEIIEKYNVVVVPLYVIIDGHEYKDGVDISPKEFYQKLAESEQIPTTSQVTPDRFESAFRTLRDQGEDVLCITIGSNASGTCQSAFIAKEQLDDEHVWVLDSNSLCMGTGYLAVMALRLSEEGYSVPEILETLSPLTENRIGHLFCVDTLEYLKKGGRIRASKAKLAEILNIKPILSVEDAITQQFGKVRGRKKIIPFYLDYLEESMDFEKSPFLSVAHSEDLAFAQKFIEAFKERFNYDKPIYISDIGATIGTHAGPGVLAVFYIKK